MTSDAGSSEARSQETGQQIEKMREYIRSQGRLFLNDPNITSIGIGHKSKGGEPTDELSIQFTVRTKASSDQLQALGTSPIPECIKIDGMDVPTDVIQRDYRPSYEVVELADKNARKRRLSIIAPGISIGHPKCTAGTLGAVVYDKRDGHPCMLSNWHVMQTPEGKVGDLVVQPGPYDDNHVSGNYVGDLVRSHLGLAGDCAIARIDNRGFDTAIMDLGVAPRQIARPELGDRVVKSGRTTDVTYGLVRRTDVVVKINYGEGVGEQQINSFEIGPDPSNPAAQREISMPGDSGSCWLVAKDDGTPSDILVGLHFAGDAPGSPDDHALACYAYAVFEKLEIALDAPAVGAEAVEGICRGEGYDPNFLGKCVRAPECNGGTASDVLLLNNSPLIPYTHFSVCMNMSRKMANFVAWNINGGALRRVSRKNQRFTYDPRIDEDYQTGNDVYADNKLDRGHLARRADLCWGSQSEAAQANTDSFYYTNITPQHERFNQSEKHGLWGELENAIFDDVDVSDLKVSVMAGPMFKDDDMEYRGVHVPSNFWKLIFYTDSQDNQLKARAYILTQDDLLNDIEALDLDPFRLWQVSIRDLESRTNLVFGEIRQHDTFTPGAVPQALTREGMPAEAREVTSRTDLII